MAIVKDKYRGTPLYFRVLNELINAAQYRGVTTYPDIASIMNLPLQGNHMGREVGQILGEISEDEVAAKRPMLSAVVVDSKWKLGKGFYELAKSLGRLKPGDFEKTFGKKERDAVYVAWKRPLSK